ncbi:hypothetical protein BDV96DRAFT_642609 [Lophiotrema nucula]|uniref:Protein kinase domain-containing protein n=1 Tax=Lophiotrema nucula TaxID=690887 RepID=A0A6A5ZIZ8_9PLEO|nr:hypothetical protein BDV96DRAFT_642609 [Lophiotrema nucula]
MDTPLHTFLTSAASRLNQEEHEYNELEDGDKSAYLEYQKDLINSIHINDRHELPGQWKALDDKEKILYRDAARDAADDSAHDSAGEIPKDDMNNLLTEKADAYSLGVVIWDLVEGGTTMKYAQSSEYTQATTNMLFKIPILKRIAWLFTRKS